MGWVERFVEDTEGIPSPPLFRQWGAISILSSAMERKVWLRSLGDEIYPNMFNLLIGGPGSGKTFVTNIVSKMLRTITEAGDPEDLYLSPTNMTKAAFADALAHAQRRHVLPDRVVAFNALAVVSNELGSLLPAYDKEMMNTLTDLYDSKIYEEHKRSTNLKIKIDSPVVNMIAGSTPAYLRNLVPEGAWEEGFFSRVILIYSGITILVDPFKEFRGALNDELISALYSIYSLYGEFTFGAEAINLIREWNEGGCEPRPTHPRLENYNARRLVHLLKLSMIASVSRKPNLDVVQADVETALQWLIGAEKQMEDLFKAMRQGGDRDLMREATEFVMQYFLRKKAGMPRHMLYGFVAERTPAHNVEKLIGVMLQAKLLKEGGPDARRVYHPGVQLK